MEICLSEDIPPIKIPILFFELGLFTVGNPYFVILLKFTFEPSSITKGDSIRLTTLENLLNERSIIYVRNCVGVNPSSADW